MHMYIYIYIYVYINRTKYYYLIYMFFKILSWALMQHVCARGLPLGLQIITMFFKALYLFLILFLSVGLYLFLFLYL
jgi:hypothetical protein